MAARTPALRADASPRAALAVAGVAPGAAAPGPLADRSVGAASDLRLRLQWRDLGDDALRLQPAAAAPSWAASLRPIAGSRGPAAAPVDEAADGPDGAASAAPLVLSLEIGAVAATTGLVWWASRAAGVLASVLATAPTWRQLDPLPILAPDAAPPPDAGDDDTPDELFEAPARRGT